MDRLSDVRPVDRLAAAYNLLLVLVWTALRDRWTFAPLLAAAHGAAATLPWLLASRGGRLSAPVRPLRELYPLLFVAAFWSELGWIRMGLHPAGHDAAVAALDLTVFGTHWNAVWMPRMPDRGLSESMHAVYFLYYPLIFLPPLAMALLGRRAALRDMVFRLLLTYAVCYVCYVSFPVDGPSHTMPRYAGALTDGFFYRLTHGAVHRGDSLGTAFPSSHVAGAVTIAWIGWRWLRPWLATLLTLEAVGVALATVYTQNHFAIDSLAGIVLACAVQAAAPLIALRLAPRPGREASGVWTLPRLVPAPSTGDGTA